MLLGTREASDTCEIDLNIAGCLWMTKAGVTLDEGQKCAEFLERWRATMSIGTMNPIVPSWFSLRTCHLGALTLPMVPEIQSGPASDIFVESNAATPSSCCCHQQGILLIRQLESFESKTWRASFCSGRSGNGRRTYARTKIRLA